MPLADVNRSDLDGAIALACRPMTTAFDDPARGTPFFRASAWPEPFFAFHPKWSEAHVSGRHLTALLEAESALGGRIDVEAAVDGHARGLYDALGGEVPLPLNRARRDATEPTVFVAHNVREALHGLASLVRYRGSERAAAAAEALIRAVRRAWHPVKGWTLPQPAGGMPPDHLVSGLGRAIGPLVKLHRAGGPASGLELAATIRDRLLELSAFPADGAFAAEPLGTHVHSITSTLSGLAMLADETGDTELLGRVRAFVADGIWTIRDETGWAIESLEAGSDPDRGEGNTSGDIAEALVILGRHGDDAAFADAERIVRSHLLPSQLRDVSFVPPRPGRDDPAAGATVSPDQVAVGPDEVRGLFGFPAPYGHLPRASDGIGVNLDIVGGVTSSLCAVRAAASGDREGTHVVDLLLDHQTEALSVRAPAPLRTATVTLHRPGPLEIRLGSTRTRIEQPPVGRPIELEIVADLHEGLLRHHDGQIWARWLGPDVVAMSDLGRPFTYFPSS